MRRTDENERTNHEHSHAMYPCQGPCPPESVAIWALSFFSHAVVTCPHVACRVGRPRPTMTRNAWPARARCRRLSSRSPALLGLCVKSLRSTQYFGGGLPGPGPGGLWRSPKPCEVRGFGVSEGSKTNKFINLGVWSLK